MSCYLNKHKGLGLLFVVYEFEASKKCQVSLVVQYTITRNTEGHNLSFCYTVYIRHLSPSI